MEYIDLRSDDDRAIEQRAQGTLDGDLEQIAKRVGQLGHEYQTMGDPHVEGDAVHRKTALRSGGTSADDVGLLQGKGSRRAVYVGQ